MSSLKVFICFGVLVCIFGSVTVMAINNAKTTEATKAESRIASLEAEKQVAKQDARLAEIAADEAVKRAQVAQGETAKTKAKLDEERAKVKIQVINGIDFIDLNFSKTQDDYIACLETELASTKTALKAKDLALANTKLALKLSEDQLIEARLAMEAHKSALKSARWDGGIKGFGIGAGTALLASLLK